MEQKNWQRISVYAFFVEVFLNKNVLSFFPFFTFSSKLAFNMQYLKYYSNEEMQFFCTNLAVEM